MSIIQQYTTIPRDGLQLEILGDGNTLDTSGNGNNGTATDVTWVEASKGYVKEVGSYNGSSSEVDTGYSTNGTSFSYSVWFYPDGDIGHHQEILNDRAGGGDETSILCYYNNTDNRWDLAIRTSGDTSALLQRSITQLPFGQWHNIVLTRDGSNCKGYHNGIFFDSFSQTGNFGTTANIHLGTNAGLTGRNFNGQIGLTRIYNRALNESEIQNLYIEGQRRLGNGASYPALMDGTVAYYDFKGDANDIVGGNNGIVTGATLTTDHLGNANSAYYFTANDIIDTGLTSGIRSGYMRVKYTATNGLLTFQEEGGGFQITSRLSQDGYITLAYHDGAWKTLNSTVTAVQDTYYDVCWTYDGTALKIYVDGELSGPVVESSITTNSTSIHLGDDGSNTMIGNMDFAIFYNRAINEDEVSTLYNLTKDKYIYPFSKSSTPNLQDGLVMSLDGDGNDQSGNGNNGTLTDVTKIRNNLSEGGDYNGSSSEINCGKALIPVNNWTISTVFKLNDISDYNMIINQYTDGETGGFIIWGNGNGELQITYGGSGNTVTPGVFGETNKYYHFTATKDSVGNHKFYLNGVNIHNWAKNIDNYQGENTKIGYTSGQSNHGMNGQIIQPKIWNRILSAKEIEAEYKLNYLN